MCEIVGCYSCDILIIFEMFLTFFEYDKKGEKIQQNYLYGVYVCFTTLNSKGVLVMIFNFKLRGSLSSNDFQTIFLPFFYANFDYVFVISKRGRLLALK